MNRKKKILDDLYNNVLPLLENQTEEYFEKKFIKENLENYEILWNFQAIEGRLESKKGMKKWKLILGDTIKNFWGNSISSEGIFTILHELTHLYQISELQEKLQNSFHILKEAHCNICPYEILINSNEFRLEDVRNYTKTYHKQIQYCLNDEKIKNNLYHSSILKAYLQRYNFKTLEEVLAYQYIYSKKNLKERTLMIFNKKDFEEYKKQFNYSILTI